MRAGGGGSRLLERPGDVGRASRDRNGRRDVVDGPGFLPAEEGRFFLDLWSRTSVHSLLKLVSIESVMLSNHLILCPPHSIPASESLPMSRLFTKR